MNKLRWLTAALVLSVAVNLLLVGVTAGRLMGGQLPERPFPTNLGWMLRGLEEADRRELRPVLEKHVQTVAPIRRQIGSAQREFNQLLKAPELNAAALSETLTDLRTASDEYQRETHAVMLSVLADLDNRQRLQIVTLLNERRRDGPPRHNRERGSRDPAGLQKPPRRSTPRNAPSETQTDPSPALPDSKDSKD